MGIAEMWCAFEKNCLQTSAVCFCLFGTCENDPKSKRAIILTVLVTRRLTQMPRNSPKCEPEAEQEQPSLWKIHHNGPSFFAAEIKL